MSRIWLLILLASFAANVVGGLVLYQRRQATPAIVISAETASRQSPGPASSEPQSDAQFLQAINRLNDDSAYVAQLRAAGFPPPILRALVHARIAARFTPRLQALKARSPKVPYWQTPSWYNADLDRSSRAEQRAIYREIADNVKALLGDDPQGLPAYERERRARSYGNLPAAKIAEIEAINRDYNEISAMVREGTQGVILAEDREKLRLLETEKRADLVRLLTPAELDEYDRRNSPAAAEIRNKLRYFEATEAEFIALYQAQRDFDARYGRDNLSGVQADQRKAALPELAQQIATALGAERFAIYDIQTDGNYFATRSLMPEIGLPEATADELVRVQRSINRRAESIRADPSLTTAQRSGQLAALASEGTASVTPLLGSADNLVKYKRYSAGDWLNRLIQESSPVTKP